MKQWSESGVNGDDFPGVPPEVLKCMITSRLLGQDPFLVLYGGGNISAKNDATVWVKASGHDMGTMTPEGLAPLEREQLHRMLRKHAMSDSNMVAGYRSALRDSGYGTPSIETLLHNYLPAHYVLHTHADAIVTLTDTADGGGLVVQALGAGVRVLPYCFPGFVLAKLIEAEIDNPRELEGIVLAHHGLFTMDDDAAEAYRKHQVLVERAEAFIQERTGVSFVEDPNESVTTESAELSHLRDRLVSAYGGEFHLVQRSSPAISKFFEIPGFPEITQRGPTTLEHVIHTKRVPAFLHNVEAYGRLYREYFAALKVGYPEDLIMLDESPRVVLDVSLGIVGVGRSASGAAIAADVYRHTVRVITAAEALGGYTPVSPQQAFDIEYWELEQAKLRA
jgi:rhamnose utilization protein RhaD (predicted bifunctional aldolase and dehydrogenase)